MTDTQVPQYWPGQYGVGGGPAPFDLVRDTVTGIEGKAVAQYNYPNGCVRYELVRLMPDGKIDDPVFDSQQLEILERAHPENTDEARAARQALYDEQKAAEKVNDAKTPGGPPVTKGVSR